MSIPWLDPEHPHFPHPDQALKDPDGLLAAGGSLDPGYLITAYSQAIFPWFSESEPILWWSPSQRAIIEPHQIHINKSFSKTLRNKPWEVRLDSDFHRMVELCATLPRDGQNGTWIVESMRQAYAKLHSNGLAHSVEIYYEGQFCGGLFGVKLGGMFYGESMASLRPDASKVALAALCLNSHSLGVELIDCQMMTPHLKTMGAQQISRADLRQRISQLTLTAKPEDWVGRLDSFEFSKALGKDAPQISSHSPPQRF